MSNWFVWSPLVCVMLAVSGGVRVLQDARFATVEMVEQKCPFDLKKIPINLGNIWQLQEGGEKQLDKEVARVAGCSDSLIRSYRNVTTGVNLTLLILYGPAKNVSGHTPEVCYPAAGYTLISSPNQHAFKSNKAIPNIFYSEVFGKNGVNLDQMEEVYYSFYHVDHWTPDAQVYWKDFRHHPAMFKVQVQRRILKSEWRTVNNPTENFLELLLPELELLMKQFTTDSQSSNLKQISITPK